jgi:hypothetical protein
MRRVPPLILGLLVIAGIIVASVVWFRAHEGDGRSDYEKVVGEEPAAASASLACFPRTPEEGKIADLNENPKSVDAIVPGEPDRLLLCRYWGMNHENRSLRLAKRKLITDSATVRLIADGLNDLPPFPDGVSACPSDEGARTYAFFAYPDDPPVVVELNSEGCSAATNGRSGVALFGDPVARQIMNLVPLPSPN